MDIDKTFTAGDLIRIFANNLEKSEQIEVACWFKLYLSGINQVDLRQKLTSQLIRKIVGQIIALFPAANIIDRLIEIFSNQLDNKELLACEEKAKLAAKGLKIPMSDFNELIVDLLTTGTWSPTLLLPEGR